MAHQNNVPAVGAPCSYVDYLNDAANDPYRTLANGYSDVLAPFAIDTQNGANNMTPATVQSLVLGAEGAVPLLLMHDNLIHVYLQPTLFQQRLGLPATQWDNNLFVSKGDLVNNHPITANWSTNYFHQINASVVAPTVDTIRNAYAADPQRNNLGPYQVGDAGTETIRTRYTCFCPAPLAALIVGEPVTPRVAFERIVGQITILGIEAQCTTLIRYLQLGVHTDDPVQVASPTAPLADQLLLNHRFTEVLYRDFPSLNRALHNINNNAIAARLGELVEDNRVQRALDNQRREKDKTKSPKELLGDAGVARLIRYTRAGSEAELAPLWGNLASVGRHDRLKEFQSHFDNEKTRLGYHRLQFRVQPSLLNTMIGVDFSMHHQDSITTGFNIYLCGQGVPEDSQVMASLYQLVTAGSAAPSLSDAAQLVAPSKPTLPRQLIQAREMFQVLQILLNIMFRAEHPLSSAVTMFISEFIARESQLQLYQPVTPGYTLCTPLLITHWFMLRMDYWFKNQAMFDAPVTVPNLLELFSLIDLRSHWEPPLPTSMLSEFKPPTMPPMMQIPSGDNGNDPPVGNGLNGGASGGANGNPPADEWPPNRVIRNHAYKQALFDEFRNKNLNHSQLRRSITVRPPPSPYNSQSGSEMCLSFHIKACCNERCSRAYDHKSHTDEQDQKLVTWCKEHYKLNSN